MCFGNVGLAKLKINIDVDVGDVGLARLRIDIDYNYCKKTIVTGI